MRKRFLPLPAATAMAAVLTASLLPACGTKDAGVRPQDRLCGGEAGVGLAVDDGADGLEFCASGADVTADYAPDGTWSILARRTVGPRTITLRMRFLRHLDAPAVLNVTADPAAAAADPDGVWIDWEEVTTGGDTLVTRDAIGGSFTLGFSDDRVAAGTMASIRLDLVRPRSTTPTAVRTLTSGFFSVGVAAAASASIRSASSPGPRPAPGRLR